jgi:hypothetical protein
VVARLLEQLAEIGVPRAHVVTRPGWEAALRNALAHFGERVEIVVSGGPGDDLAQVARIARERPGGLVLAAAEVVTHRSALAGLLANPGVVTGVLSTAGRHGAPFAPPARSTRGRILSASSTYHSAHSPRIAFLGVLKVAPADQVAFAAVAERLAALTAAGVPPEWELELERRVEEWRLALAKRVMRAERAVAREEAEAAGAPAGEEPALLPPEEHAERRRALARALPRAEEAELARRLAAARQDVLSLLLVGLVREGVHVGQSFVRRLFWARPLSAAEAQEAAADIQGYDEDREMLDSAVKATDGFFTTYFVSTWSRYVARWAARRGLTPNQVTVASLCIGIAAAAGFATGERAGLIAGAVLLYLAFVADCVDGQLARYTRQFSKFGAWLDSILDRTKEYVAFAGLAIGAGTAEVWALAAAALTLQTVRHAFDFSWGAADRQAVTSVPQPPVEQAPDAALERIRMSARGSLEPRLGLLEPRAAGAPAPPPAEGENGARPQQNRSLARRVLGLWRVFDRLPFFPWLKRMFVFPIGERFAVISITAAVSGPRTTFLVVLAWGGVAFLYTLAGRTLRSVARR